MQHTVSSTVKPTTEFPLTDANLFYIMDRDAKIVIAVLSDEDEAPDDALLVMSLPEIRRIGATLEKALLKVRDEFNAHKGKTK